MGFKANLKHCISVYLGRNHRGWFTSRLSKMAHKIYMATENLNFDVDTNGEARLVEILAKHQPKIIVDAGANVGHYAKFLHRECTMAEIHCFEPSPTTYKALSEHVGGLDRLHLHPFGLSNEETSMTFLHYPHKHWESRIKNEKEEDAELLEGAEEIEIYLKKGDEYCQELGVEHINYLKIDVEGHEHQVLFGFDEFLKNKKIDLIQLEYGTLNLVTGFILKDFVHLAKKYGYVVGKIYPDSVDFSEYTSEKDNFIGPNIALINPEKKALYDDLESLSVKTKGQRSYLQMLIKRSH